MEEKIYDIISEYDESGGLDECTEEIEKYMDSLVEIGEILTYDILSDSDVFDSCGLDIFYVAVAWVDTNSNVHIIGDRLTSC